MRKLKVDRNQGEIVELLRQLGVSVFDTHTVGRGFTDAVLGFRGTTYLAEIKDGKRLGWKLTPAQKKFIVRWNGSAIVIFTCTDDVLTWVESKKHERYRPSIRA